MLLQTNSYIVPKEKRTEHARLLQRFKVLLAKHGCEHFEAYEQVGANWAGSEASGRFVQIMRFRDRAQWMAVQQAEKEDPQAKQLIAEFCELVNLPYQMQAGLFSAVYFTGVITQHTPQKAVAPAPRRAAISPVQMAASAAAGAVAAEHVADIVSEEAPAPDLPVGDLPSSDVPQKDDTAFAAASLGEETSSDAGDANALADLSAAVAESNTSAEANGDSNVLEFLVDPQPASSDSDDRQRID
jgi:hypothetical protein